MHYAVGSSILLSVSLPYALGPQALLLKGRKRREEPRSLTGDARLEFLRNSGPAPEMQMERAGQ